MLYEREGRYEKLAALLEHRLETDTRGRDRRPQGAPRAIDLDQLHEPAARARSPRRGAAPRRGQSRGGRQLVERILEIGSLRTRAAECSKRSTTRATRCATRARARDPPGRGAERRPAARAAPPHRGAARRAPPDDAGALEPLSRLVPLEPTDVTARDRLTEIGKTARRARARGRRAHPGRRRCQRCPPALGDL